MPVLRSPAVYIASTNYGRPVSLGSVYVFNTGVSIPSSTASVNPSDLVDIYYNNESGSQIAVSQPLRTSKGGTLYSDDPVIIRQYYTDDASYQFAVYDTSGALQYYDTMSNTFGGGGGGGSTAGAATITNDWNTAITAGFYQSASTATLNQPVSGRRFVGWVSNTTETGENLTQMVADITQDDGPAYVRVRSGGVFGDWRQVWDSASFTRQTSALDDTVNAAMLTGAGGLVGDAVPWGNSVRDIELTAFYALEGTASDTPTGITITDSTLIHVNVDSVSAYQILIAAGTGEMWTSVKSGTWGGWRRAGQTPLNAKTGNYQLLSSDFGGTVRFSGGTTATLTIVPAIGYDGGLIQIINRNSGTLSINPSGVTLSWLTGGSVATGSRVMLPHSSATLIAISSTGYEIVGFGLS